MLARPLRPVPSGTPTRVAFGWAIVPLLCLTPIAAGAGEADVLEVSVTSTGGGTYRFDVTVQHADTGWDHYADAWEVLAPDGTVLGARRLLHPHTEEQPSPVRSSASRSRRG
jgi:hypothetical protein